MRRRPQWAMTTGGRPGPDEGAPASVAAPEPDVRLEGVSKRFKDTVAVAGIDLAISPGEFFSLLGPSGCGKSTTLAIIGGFEETTEGVGR